MSYSYKTVKLGDICSSVCSGGTPSTKNDSFYKGGTIPWLNTKEINFNNIYDTEVHITEEGLNNSSAKWIEANSINIAMYGATAGRVSINRIPLTTNQACCNLKINSDKSDYRFVYYWLKQNYQYILSLANGGAQQNLNSGLIKDLEIKLPCLSVQNKIADILSSFDKKIELNTRINSQICKIRNLYISNTFDFYNIKDCAEIPITDIAEIQGGYSYKSSEFDDLSNIGMLTIKNFNRDGTFKIDGIKRISPIKLKESHVVSVGDIVVSHTDLTQNADIIGRAVSVIDDCGYDKLIASCDLVKVSSKDKDISNELLAAILSTEHFHLYCQQYINGTTVLHLSKKALPNYILRIPKNKSLIQEMNSVFISLNTMQANILIENRVLSELRDTLLPKLMSGEIEV